jgi:L-alanine-DL-glutamate epimerase-like enolase superfamily enzyme
MQIEAVDFFYLSMPEITLEGDGSQDALLVRVASGGHLGWGECEASPLPSIAAAVCPRSHGACQPVLDSVLGQSFDDVADIARIARLVGRNSLDLLQTDHTWSGIEIALWDLLGKHLSAPVYKLLGTAKAHPKRPYASLLFGDDPAATLEKAKAMRARNFRAVKFGWGPYGQSTAAADRDQLAAAREGLGPDGIMLIDAGAIWVDDLAAAAARLAALNEFGALWLEEPFVSGALDAYRELARQSGAVRLAAGEGSHNTYMARHLIDYGGVGFIQIDTGPHRRHRPGEGGRGLRCRARRHLRQSHLHHASRPRRLAGALCRAGIARDLRVPRRAQAPRLRAHAQSFAAGRRWATPASRGARARHDDRAPGGRTLSRRCRD